MPISTEHFLLEAFLDGDAYYSLADKRRFSTVDNQFHAMTIITGDGRIDGWEIQQLTFPNIRITIGSGFIDNHYVSTFNDQDFVLSADTTFNIFAQRRVGVIATVGPRSDIASLTYDDAAPPAAPAIFAATLPTSDSFFSINLTWTANTEIDLDHYEIERTSDYPPANFTLVATINKPTVSFTDTVGEDTTFYYQIFAVDQSGNRSSASTLNITTDLSPDLPPNPFDIIMPHSEGSINILWKRPIAIPFADISHWELTWVRLRSDETEISSTQQSRIVSKNLFVDRIDGLQNGSTYKVTLRTVDFKNRKSIGISKSVTPQTTPAPHDPDFIANPSQTEGPGGVIVNLTWIDGADEYDSLIAYTYRVYITINGLQESLPIFVSPIGALEEQIELFTFDGFKFSFIPEDTLVTFRVTAVTQNGIESFGNYRRFITTKFSKPLPVGNLSSDFDQGNGEIVVTWRNQADTSSVSVQVLDEDLNDVYEAGEIINESVGLIERFAFTAEIDHTYTIVVTAFDSTGTASDSDSTIETTRIAGGVAPPDIPSDLSPQTGDKQLAFTWRASKSIAVTLYKIYRKLGSVTVRTKDWTLIDTVPSTINKFEDFGLTNDQLYSYYITAVDLFGQESFHLPDGAINLNYIELIPKPAGILTPADNVELVLTGNDILVTWESLLEEFDAFTVYRSIGNLHLWEAIVTVDANTLSYLDEDLRLADGTIFYYTVGKSINDADFVVQVSSTAPESSIVLGKLTLGTSSFGALDISNRRDLQDLVDPITEITDVRLLGHKHAGIGKFDPERIDLNPELIVTSWTTIDGRIFTTLEDISGTGHIVKIDGRFPSTLFSIDTSTKRLVFAEPIVEVDIAGNITGTLPDLEVRVLGVEEVQGILDTSRFDEIHARQVAFGRLNKEQLPSLNHEGRIRERMLPERFLLERFSNHTFIVSQTNTDITKTFGDGTTFYAIIESDGLIKEVIDFDPEDDGTLVGFRNPSFSTDTTANLDQHVVNTSLASANDNAHELRFISSELLSLAFILSVPATSPLFAVNRGTLSVGRAAGDADAGLSSPQAFTVDTSSNIAYVANSFSDLYTIDLRSGETTLLGTVTIPTGFGAIKALEFNHDNGILYGILQGTENILVTVDPSSLTASRVHPTNLLALGIPSWFGLAYDQDSNVMYASSALSGDDFLWTVDLATGVATKVHPTNDIGEDVTSLTFDYDNGKLYGTSIISGGTKLIEIDPATGLGTSLGTVIPPGPIGPIFKYIEGLHARPKDTSLWQAGVSNLYLGQDIGSFSDVYVRFKINFNVGSNVGTSSLQFTAHSTLASIGTVDLQVSILDPSQYADSIDLRTEVIKNAATLITTAWSPPNWSLGEQSSNTSFDVTSMLQTFVDNAAYSKGRHAIFKIETLATSTLENVRIAESFAGSNGPILATAHVNDIAEVTSETAFQSEKSYHFQFSFVDTTATRWVRITTFDTPNKPNPIIDLKKRIRF